MWMKIEELFSTPFRTQSRRCKIRELLLCVMSSFNKRTQALTTFILVIASFLCQKSIVIKSHVIYSSRTMMGRERESEENRFSAVKSAINWKMTTNKSYRTEDVDRANISDEWKCANKVVVGRRKTVTSSKKDSFINHFCCTELEWASKVRHKKRYSGQHSIEEPMR